MSALSVACPTCLKPAGEPCVNMYDATPRSPHESRTALVVLGPEALSAMTGELDADPDERIKPLDSWTPHTPAEIPYTPRPTVRLRKAIPDVDPYVERTVLRWTRRWPDGDEYTYVAVKARGKWWLTGKTSDGLSWDELSSEHLAHATVMEKVVTWETIGVRGW
jgi:hypothetical protein